MAEPNPDLMQLFSAIMLALARAARAAAASFEDSVGHHDSEQPPHQGPPIESYPGSGEPPPPPQP